MVGSQAMHYLPLPSWQQTLSHQVAVALLRTAGRLCQRALALDFKGCGIELLAAELPHIQEAPAPEADVAGTPTLHRAATARSGDRVPPCHLP